jgi:glycolate oxidase
VELVTPDGDIVWLGGKVEGAPGYDLLGTCVGSEGTFRHCDARLGQADEAAAKRQHHAGDLSMISTKARRLCPMSSQRASFPPRWKCWMTCFLPCIEQAYKFGFPLMPPRFC